MGTWILDSVWNLGALTTKKQTWGLKFLTPLVGLCMIWYNYLLIEYFLGTTHMVKMMFSDPHESEVQQESTNAWINIIKSWYLLIWINMKGKKPALSCPHTKISCIVPLPEIIKGLLTVTNRWFPLISRL